MAVEREPATHRAPAWPQRLHPYTRNLIRWRAQHLASAARQLERGELSWEWTLIPRYTVYDGRTTQKATPSASPRLVPFRDKKPVGIPPARTLPFEVSWHVLVLTPALLGEALELMRFEGAHDAWLAFVSAPHPPTIFRAHKRDGIVPTDEVRFNGSLKTAAGILGWLATRREELGGI